MIPCNTTKISTGMTFIVKDFLKNLIFTTTANFTFTPLFYDSESYSTIIPVTKAKKQKPSEIPLSFLYVACLNIYEALLFNLLTIPQTNFLLHFTVIELISGSCSISIIEIQSLCINTRSRFLIFFLSFLHISISIIFSNKNIIIA